MTPFCRFALVCNQSHTSRGLRSFFRDQEKKRTKQILSHFFILFFDQQKEKPRNAVD